MQTKVKIKGYDWTVKLLTPKQFTKEANKYDAMDAAAFTTKDGISRVIAFQKGEMTPGCIRHEILHAIIAESRVDSADLSPLQIEELCCEIMDYDWMMYLGLVEEILAAFC